MNCVLESMRKSLKTEWRQLSVALVSRIRLSNCFSISWVFDNIFWEKSWRNRKSCEDKAIKKAAVAGSLSVHFTSVNYSSKYPTTTLPSAISKAFPYFFQFCQILEKKKVFWFTPESAARDQLALVCRISSRVQGLSQIWASLSESSLLLEPLAMPSGNPLICSQTLIVIVGINNSDMFLYGAPLFAFTNYNPICKLMVWKKNWHIYACV